MISDNQRFYDRLIIDKEGKFGIGTIYLDDTALVTFNNYANSPYLDTKLTVKSDRGSSFLEIKSKNMSDSFVAFQTGNGYWWSIGSDGSSGQKFKISQSSGVGQRDVLSIGIDGRIEFNSLSGSGNAYACLDAGGVLFRSNVPCTQSINSTNTTNSSR